MKYTDKSIDKYHQSGYDIRVCRVVRYKYVCGMVYRADITGTSE